MKRGEIYWARLEPPLGRRPVLIVTRDPAIEHVGEVTVAPITTNTRGVASEVALGEDEGLARASAANCLGLRTIPKAALSKRSIGRLRADRVATLDRALTYALGIEDPLTPTRSSPAAST